MSVKARLRVTLYLLVFCLMICEIFISSAARTVYVKTELLLLVTVFSGLYLGPRYGAEMGFFSGLLKDLISIGPFGIAALSFFIVGLLCGYLKNRLTRETFFTQVLVSFVSSVFFSFMVLGCLKTFSGVLPDRIILKNILFQALLTGALSLPFFFVFGAVFRRAGSQVFEANP
ncbi:MAG: rod shape-determining protein MreD [Candidatus Omnitrophica bacterium]|nr:rod shape-determining protein MreD [Candidatus Omnitrophota bacterium]